MPSALTQMQITKNVLPIYWGYESQRYISTMIAPNTATTKQSGYIISLGDAYLRPVNGEVASTSPASAIDDEFSTTEYNLKRYRWSYKIADEDKEEWELPVESAQLAMRALTAQSAVNREMLLSAWMTDTDNFTNKIDITADSTSWDDASATIDEDIWEQEEAVRSAIGVRPNTMVVTADTYRYLRIWVKNYLENSGRVKMPTDKDIADFFGFDNFVVATARYISSAKGATTAYTDCWGSEGCWLLYVKSSPKEEPAFACTVTGKKDLEFKTYRENNPEADVHILKANMQVKILNETSGAYLYNVLA